MFSKTHSTADFPFYSGTPVSISPYGWLILLFSVGAAFAMLALLPLQLPAMLAEGIKALLFMGIPLATLAMLTGRHWTALFRRVGRREVGLMLLTAFATIAASAAAAMAVRAFSSTAANPLITDMATMPRADFFQRLVPTLPQLLGEELLTVLPFLAILWFATQRLKITRKTSILLALAGSTAIFSAAHLPTYNWQVAQCFGVIGTARIVLTLSYIWSRNLWVSTGAHILNDWSEFAFVYGLSHVPIDAG